MIHNQVFDTLVILASSLVGGSSPSTSTVSVQLITNLFGQSFTEHLAYEAAVD
jgi:hypothetical protein